jgi:AraC-like DNA-binding protein
MLIDISTVSPAFGTNTTEPIVLRGRGAVLQMSAQRLAEMPVPVMSTDTQGTIEISESIAIPPSPRGPTLALWQERRIRQYVEANWSRPISTGELIEITRLSTGYFFKAFKMTFGMSPHTFVVERRIEKAKTLLAFTDEAICEIALACGLNDQSHLSRLFRQVTGTSPGAWRRQHHRPSHGEPRHETVAQIVREAFGT